MYCFYILFVVFKFKVRFLFAAWPPIAAALFVFSGCATSPIQNRRLTEFDGNRGYRLSNVDPADGNSDSLLVMVSLSGGGTRAASLAYGVFETLRDTSIVWDGAERSLLDEVDVISSVSGGSLVSAYYGLFGDRLFEDFPRKVLYKDIQGNILRRLFSPVTNAKIASPFFTRTDVLADRFHHTIFERKTYADLVDLGGPPFVIVNATDLNFGNRFEFTQDQFDVLYSDLSSFPVAYAVAASSAYPGIFPPIAIRNFDAGNDYEKPEWMRGAGEDNRPPAGPARYALSYCTTGNTNIYVSDGGVADNLGLLPIIRILDQDRPGVTQVPDPLLAKAETILVVTVNAAMKAPREWDMTQSAIGLVHTLLAAGGNLIGNFTQIEIDLLNLLVEREQLRRIHNVEGKDRHILPEIHFVEVSFDQLFDPEERQALNGLPTSFKLPRESVDRLRAAAKTILSENDDFRGFLEGLEE